MATRYAIATKPAFDRAFDKLTRKNKALAEKLRDAIDRLAEQPRPPGSEKLEDVEDGGEPVYRVRSGSYRILYVIRDRQLLVLLVHVGDRKEVYR